MSRYQEALHRRREPRLGALAPRRCSRPLRPLLSRLYTAEGPSQYLKPSTDEPAVAQQAPAGCSVAPPPLRPASEAYGGVRPARAEQPPGNTLATPNRRPSTCSQPRMGSPPSSHHRHITCAQSNALFPIGFATRKTISIYTPSGYPFNRTKHYVLWCKPSGGDKLMLLHGIRYVRRAS